MMNMMTTTGFGFSLLWAIHIAAVIASFTGLFLLILWAVKTWDPAKLKTWGLWLLVLGVVACLLTIAVRGGPWLAPGSPWGGVGIGYDKGGMRMQGRMMGMMMDRMMEHDRSVTGEAHEEHEDMMDMMKMMRGGMMGDDKDAMGHGDAMGMSMDDMTEALEGKTGDSFDAAFIEGMIPHHQGAIEMARMALRSAKHEEIKSMANAIIAAQQGEIDQMKAWRKAWGYGN